jgi:hypothetical protein
MRSRAGVAGEEGALCDLKRVFKTTLAKEENR